MLNRLLTATTGALLVSGSALAADLPAPERNLSFMAPAERRVPSISRFEGPFVGLNFGGGKSAALKGGDGRSKGDTFVVGGVRAGYNWQKGPLVLGVEAGVNPVFRGKKRSAGARSSFGFADARLKIGLANDRAMIYGFGGVAVLSATQIGAPFDAGRSPPYNGLSKMERRSLIAGGGKTYNPTRLKTGLIVGAGFEYALDDSWSVKAEAAHVTARGLVGGGKKRRASENIVVVGLNYRF